MAKDALNLFDNMYITFMSEEKSNKEELKNSSRKKPTSFLDPARHNELLEKLLKVQMPAVLDPEPMEPGEC